MALTLEIFTEIMFDAAMLIFVLQLARHIGQKVPGAGFTSVLTGIGFILYGIAKCVSGGSYAVYILSLLGFYALIYRFYIYFFKGMIDYAEKKSCKKADVRYLPCRSVHYSVGRISGRIYI